MRELHVKKGNEKTNTECEMLRVGGGAEEKCMQERKQKLEQIFGKMYICCRKYFPFCAHVGEKYFHARERDRKRVGWGAKSYFA